MIDFDIACAQIQGAREGQEDCAVVWPGPATFTPVNDWPEQAAGEILAVLADGMGGHAAGDIASRIACEAFVTSYHDSLSESGAGTGTAARTERLATAADAANTGLANAVSVEQSLKGMGTTLIGALFTEDGLEWVSVGDSPLFLIRDGELALLNEDHSLAPALDKLVAEGRLTPERARNDPRRHMLRSAINGEKIELIDLSRKPLALAAGDIVIAASDGLETLERDEIARIATGYSRDGAQAVTEALLRAVENAREEYQDNATVITVKL
jgi:serine/threonine protein phosphatase PrpC